MATRRSKASAPSVFGTTALVVGKESVLAERAVATRLAAARSEVPDVEISKVWARDLAGTNQFAEIVGASLFASQRAVVINDLAELPAELANLLLATASDPGEGLCLTLVHGGGQKGKKLLDSLKNAGIERYDAEPIKPWKIGDFVASEARSQGLRMDQSAIRGLLDAVGTDLRAIVAAVAQLASDWPDDLVTAEVIARYFTGRAEVTGFQVADLAMMGRTGEALVRLRWALEANVAPVLITSAMASALRTVGRYFGVRGLRMPPHEVAVQIGVPPWKVKSLPDQARHWTPATLAKALVAVAHADAEVKGAAYDSSFALEQMLLSIDAARAGE